MTEDEARETILRYVRQDLEWQQIASALLEATADGITAFQVTTELRRRLLERGETLVDGERVQAAAEILGSDAVEELLSSVRYMPKIGAKR